MDIKIDKIIIYASALLVVSAIFSGVTSFVLSKDIQRTQSDNALYCSNNGNILYVGGTGPNNYTSIQAAIDNASNGDTVFVYDDSSPYYENVVIDKSINLLGENKETTIIDGRKDKEKTVVRVKAPFVNISLFTIVGNKTGYNRDFAGILLESGAPYATILNCQLHGFVNAILSNWYVANHIVSSCKFWDCTRAINFPCGDFGEAGSNVISNCDISAPSGVWINFNTIISNCTFSSSKVVILDGSNDTLINNHFINGYIQMEYSSHIILRNNTLEDSGLIIFGHGVEDFHHDIDASNTMQGKPIYYFYDKKDMVIDKNSNTGYIILASCQNITVKNLDLYGSVLAFSFNNTFENCSFYGNSVGLYLHNSTYNSINKCRFENYYPLMIEQSCKNNISYCTFSGRWIHDIQIWHSSNENMIIGCTLDGCGIFLGDAHNNTVVKCSISNSKYGIEIDGNDNLVSLCNISYNKIGVFVGGYSNRIYLNNFIENSINAFCYGQNIWNTREMGNYWDDYRGFDLNKDGIGFIPYHIRTDHIWSIFNFDWHPLMHPL